MHAWLYVLAVLAISHGATKVAGTDADPSLHPVKERLKTHSIDSGGPEQSPAVLANDIDTHSDSTPSTPALAGVSVSPSGSDGDIGEYKEYLAFSGSVLAASDAPEDRDTVEPELANVVDDDESGSHHEDGASRPDPKALVEIEKNLLSLFGFPNRPKIDRSKVVIPEAMKQLYAQIMGHDLVDSVSVPKEGLNTRNANTVRSFTHEDPRCRGVWPLRWSTRWPMHFNCTHLLPSGIETRWAREP